jgi:hypothetical protein
MGGYNGTNYLSSCEIFDPGIRDTLTGLGVWEITASLSIPRASHSSCVITDIKPYVIAIGGENNTGDLVSIEEYDIGLGYRSEWQSQIHNYPGVTLISDSMVIEGKLFRGVSEADGGNHCHIMSTDHPIISLLRVSGGNFMSNGGGEFLYMPLSSSWSDNHTIVHTRDLPEGYYQLWSIVNGIPCKWYEECTLVEEDDAKSQEFGSLQVFPNPTTVKKGIEFQITGILGSQKVSLQIYDLSGRLVKKEILSIKDKVIKLNNLKSGIYFYRVNIKVKNKDIEKRGKFIIL